MSEPTELLPKGLVLEVLNAYIDHIASPNACVLLREIKAEVLRMRANRWHAFSTEELGILDYYLDIESENTPIQARLAMVEQLQAELARRAAKEGK
jgi:hypothetical protein